MLPGAETPKKSSKIIKQRGATRHSEKTGRPFFKVACSLTFLDDFGLLLERFETCRNSNMEGAPLPSPLGMGEGKGGEGGIGRARKGSRDIT